VNRAARLVVLGLLCLATAACGEISAVANPNAARVGGSLDVPGPLLVHGDLLVGGTATIHGPVSARALHVGGSVTTPFARGEPPGPAGQEYATELVVGGSLAVQGPLIVDGSLRVGGSLLMEPAQGTAGEAPPQFDDRQQLWTE